jgi:two-component system, OmpR family, response regulator
VLRGLPAQVILSIIDNPRDHDLRMSTLDAGADIGLAKPLAFSELDARLVVLSRNAVECPEKAFHSKLVLYRMTRCLNGRSAARAKLSRREYLSLERLLRGTGTAVEQSEAMAYAFDNVDPELAPLRRLVTELRRRIAKAGIELEIETIPRVGYRAINAQD